MTPISDFISVDLPMPLRPTSATISPALRRQVDAVQDLALPVGDGKVVNFKHPVASLNVRDRLP